MAWGSASNNYVFFAGFEYSRRNDLPQGTISISNQNLTIVDSSFTNLAAFGQASIILQNSAVVFDNVTFNGNYQSNAGAINVNSSSNATILNSVIINNFGYQAGAIAVGCKCHHTLFLQQYTCSSYASFCASSCGCRRQHLLHSHLCHTPPPPTPPLLFTRSYPPVAGL